MRDSIWEFKDSWWRHDKFLNFPAYENPRSNPQTLVNVVISSIASKLIRLWILFMTDISAGVFFNRKWNALKLDWLFRRQTRISPKSSSSIPTRREEKIDILSISTADLCQVYWNTSIYTYTSAFWWLRESLPVFDQFGHDKSLETSLWIKSDMCSD